MKATQVQKVIVFRLDNESIAGIDLAKHGSNTQNISIALNFSSQKQKQEATLGLLHNAVFLAEAFEKSTNILVKALVAGQISDIRSSLSFLSTFHTQAPNSNNLRKFNQCITQIETELEDMAIELGNMKNMLKSIFIAVSEGGQRNNVPTTSTNNNNNISF